MRGHLCDGHARAWRRDGQPPLRTWVREGARSLRGERVAVACAAAGCRRSVHVHGLCQAHVRHWARAGRPPLAAFASAAPAVMASGERCRVSGCGFAAIAEQGFCDSHHKRFGWLRSRRPGLGPDDYIEQLTSVREQAGPRFDLRGPRGGRRARAGLRAAVPPGRARRGDHAAGVRAGRPLAA
jgi:hypothetical protein